MIIIGGKEKERCPDTPLPLMYWQRTQSAILRFIDGYFTHTDRRVEGWVETPLLE